MKKSLITATLVLSTAMGLLLSACGAKPAPASPESNQSAPYKIGVVQLLEHPALDAAYQGFVDALAQQGYEDGQQVEYDFQNAQGDISNLSTIGDRFVSRQSDLILAITTDAAQAMAAKTTSIPILGTAVTSYSVAGLIESEEKPGGNVSGTSDMNPVAAQIDLLLELVSEAETVGLIYNSSEKNSLLQIELAKEAVTAKGRQWQEITVTNTNDILQAMESLVGKCQAIYIPTDNTLASAMPTVHSVAGEARIPTVCGESNMVLSGGLATMGIDYYSLGYKTGLMAIEVMNGANPAEMPIQYADSSDEVTINGQVAEEIGFTVPKKYQDCVIYPQ